MFHVKQKNYDVIVVGAGHAGTEAAFASSRMGAKTAMITFSMKDIGQMSCNPAMGGLGKGHLIREIDALGGLMGMASDNSGIQFRMLNATKGEAVRGPRAQIDRDLYKKNVRKIIFDEDIDIIEDEVVDIILCKKKQTVGSISLARTGKINCKTIIVTTGTFLNGLIHRGSKNWKAGRLGAKPSLQLSNFFERQNFGIKRLKTGTPPRLLSKSIDFKKCMVQEGDKNPVPFSYLTQKIRAPQIPCYITRTNLFVHEVIRQHINFSPMYNGKIKSKGPRYCPSIEDKVKRFQDRESHQIFLEPETLSNEIIYPNGISTALPSKVQDEFLRLIPGLERVKVSKYGYAIEYNCIESSEIKETYETKKIKGLFLAGQINGSTGYEEAAAQGLMAGINAANKVSGKRKFNLERTESYIGVLTDDLIKGGLEEPYRMFTSRAEYRLLLRADNADERLTDKSINLGLACKKRMNLWNKKKKLLTNKEKELKSLKASPKHILDCGVKINQDGKKRTAFEILGYSKVTWNMVEKIWPELSVSNELTKNDKEQIRIKASYEKYILRQKSEIDSLRKDSGLKLAKNINLNKCLGISNEIKDVLKKNKPRSIGEASRLPGMTPAAATLLLRFVKKSS
ncbi:tRNA uridine-5-carboxymethylaminomethyl(34) synthesis enzyme MnmG [Rickettsiales bacterium]|nr:tRNA uridine-5-carboxymethylaminomethyl(34) synthesis enzyme MnmG [Rickettsiales bacterium]